MFAEIENSSSSELALQARLRKSWPDDIVRMAITISELRRRATAKFSHASQMWFDRQGLEQSTSELVSQHKARRFTGRVWDLCSGIGGDAIALARHCQVTAVDLNPSSCLRSEWNAEVHGVDSQLITDCSDVTSRNRFEDLVHIDPDRRPGSSGRVSRIEDYVPGIEYLQQLMANSPGGAIKLSPASNFGGKFDEAEIELISLNGECKEATIWFGSLAREGPYRATVLPAGESLSGHPLQVAVPVLELGKYLYDPDPAVVRAGLVDVLADQLGLTRLDAAEEYLTSDQLVTSPFVQAFEVLTNLSNNERDLKNWLRNQETGQLEIKCRHIPVQTDALRRKLKLAGTQAHTILFARLEGKARIIGARRITTRSTSDPKIG